MIGSTRAARRAGSHPARSAVIPSTDAATPSTPTVPGVKLKTIPRATSVNRSAAQVPIANAEVQLTTSGVPLASTKTTADGGFAFLEISPGTYTMTGLSQGGTALVSSTVTVQQGIPTSVTLTTPSAVVGAR